MSILGRLFKTRAPAPLVSHPDFGDLRFSKHDGFINPGFEFWEYHPVELLVDAPESGPSAEQEQAFHQLRERKSELLPRCLETLSALRSEMQLSPATFVVAGLTIPSFRPEPQGQLWTLWFDAEGDDHFMYGVQSDDLWVTLHAFADD